MSKINGGQETAQAIVNQEPKETIVNMPTVKDVENIAKEKKIYVHKLSVFTEEEEIINFKIVLSNAEPINTIDKFVANHSLMLNTLVVLSSVSTMGYVDDYLTDDGISIIDVNTNPHDYTITKIKDSIFPC